MLRPVWALLALCLLTFPMLLSGCPTSVCDAGSTQICACPGGTTGAQACSSDGSRWGDCECPDGDDDDATADDDDATPDDDDVTPDDDDVTPDDDDVTPPDDDDVTPPDDDDVTPPDDDDVTPPDDDDVTPPDDDDVVPDDDDVVPDDDDVVPDDDDSAVIPGFPPPVACVVGVTDCSDPGFCTYAVGCACVSTSFGEYCMPNCPGGQPDCDALAAPFPLTCASGTCQ